MGFSKGHILGINELSAGDINEILKTAESMKVVSSRNVKKVPTLKGITVVNLFFEPSTRTRASFEIAEKRLSADVLNLSLGQSSVQKGETLLDTIKNLKAMGASIIVIRHPMSGAPWLLAKELDCSIINAGDGSHEHPSQSLIDLFTVKEIKKEIKGLNVVIVGDILHSRVARSNIWGFNKLGASVSVVGPPTVIPEYVDELNVKKYYSIEQALEGADVVIMLRIQKERQDRNLFPSMREYSKFYGLTKQRLSLAKDDVILMHPGPINRGIELSSELADNSQSVILDQVANGIAVRMSMLYHVAQSRGDN
ncbi:MAG: aspartate carbamoyltransferase catalytic subunit [Candidatus Dadabacteria bacterium]|nr:aspartate carbamoyltransferase catalytic subunit [Candidatus Dadabacteria bacterium]NIS07758.1 aspartate carbamoyltransferase catalytic subunit [Candidatus Dadabacteria bacterium]NIV40997.1 aspartate carbamoyltransferase catalytic subunit [Candidatus Dadabacteria bacterium]NIX14410.1 aspartate carbamoyltransferase catalytic subunit [Candidatus Dadabacteria bacterium]NIY20922.1 aspartate carbamoyltransferase catalytic subunit [Candidatus Dadabacteria bacterium]